MQGIIVKNAILLIIDPFYFVIIVKNGVLSKIKTVKLLTDPFVNYQKQTDTFSTIRANMSMKMNTKMNTI